MAPELVWTTGVWISGHMTKHHMQGIGNLGPHASQQKQIVTLRLLFVIGTAEEVPLRSILTSSPATSLFISHNISQTLLGSTYQARHFCQFPWKTRDWAGLYYLSFYLSVSPLQDTLNHIGPSFPVAVLNQPWPPSPLFISYKRLDSTMLAISAALRVENMRDLLSAMGSLASWRTLALILAFINLKNLPFVWHVCIFRIPPSNCSSNLTLASM